MFSKRGALDLKKSFCKVLDVRKESVARIKHLRIILEAGDNDEAKHFLENNYSLIYFAFNDLMEYNESISKQKSHKQHKEEIEQILFILEKILILLPELIHKKWQLNSFTRIMKKILHPGNSLKIRKDAIKVFLIWFHIVGYNATEEMRLLFSTLVPGINKKNESLIYCEDSSVLLSQEEILPIYPAQKDEKYLNDMTVIFIEFLLDCFIVVITKPEWKIKNGKPRNSFFFLLEEFKNWYLVYIFPNFCLQSSLYNPVLILPEAYYIDNMNQVYENGKIIECSEIQGQMQIALIKWLFKLSENLPQFDLDDICSHENRDYPSHNADIEKAVNSLSIPPLNISLVQNISDKEKLPFSLDQSSYFTTKETILPSDLELSKKFLYSSRTTVAFVHECFRQTFFMHPKFSIAARKVLVLYKDWLMHQTCSIPEFLKEPIVKTGCMKLPTDDNSQYSIRAGLQNLLKYFLSSSCNIFVMNVKEHFTFLNDQVEIAKRILNLYRHIVMKIELEQKTWEQLLIVLLHIVSNVMTRVVPLKKEATLGGRMASGMFQTLIVSWFRANLNVMIPTDLWDQLLSVLSSRTNWEELINEWGKTVTTLTRIVAKHLFDLDLYNLPLNHISEQKLKRKKGLQQLKPLSASTEIPPKEYNTVIVTRKENIESKFSPVTFYSHELEKLATSSSKSYKKLNFLFEEKYRKKDYLKRCFSEKDIPQGSDIIIHISDYLAEYGICKEKEFVDSIINFQLIVKSKSEDSLNVLKKHEFLYEFSRSASPALSTNQESSSIKDSPIQLDIGDHLKSDDAEGKPVMIGGNLKGWRPDVAYVLWKRLIGALGNPNAISSPDIHKCFFSILNELCDTLIKIRQNMGISLDNTVTPPTPDIILPMAFIIPWCFQCVTLPFSHKKGKLVAFEIICKVFFAPQDVPFTKDELIHFYYVMKFGLSGSDKEITNAIIKWCGPLFISALLPGSSLLLLDFLFAANSILSSDYKNLPRLEAIITVASMIVYVSEIPSISVLTFVDGNMRLTTVTDAKDSVIDILLKSGKYDSNSDTKLIALNGLTVFIFSELDRNVNQKKIIEAIFVIMKALKSGEVEIAQMACDMILCLVTKVDKMINYIEIIRLIIIGLCDSLSELIQQVTMSHIQKIEVKRLILSVLFCIGNWCMNIPLSILLHEKWNEKQLLLLIFEVLDRSSCVKNCEYDKIEFDSNNKSFFQEHTISLCAKTVTQHLINHLNQFPLNIGASSSLVTEQDDVQCSDEALCLNSLCSPNIQIIMVNNYCLLSFVELPVQDSTGWGITGSLITASNQVRVIMRNLFGKFCWDASVLFGTSEQCLKSCTIPSFPIVSWNNHKISNHENENKKFYENNDNINSRSTYAFNSDLKTVSKHSCNILPFHNNFNANFHADCLSSLLCYIGCTSSECLKVPGCLLNEPNLASIYLSMDIEDNIIKEIINQKNSEVLYLTNHTQNINKITSECSIPLLQNSQFHTSRLLFTNLGFANIEKRHDINLVTKSDKFLREIKNLDNQKCRETHKIAVVYVAPGQEDKNSILSNTIGSQDFEEFVSGLGWEVELETHTGFLGGLQKSGINGKSAPYYATAFCEVIFHVSTRMPYTGDSNCILQKMKHLGNDEVHIVWSDHHRKYRKTILATEFCDVLIAVYPMKNGLFNIEITKKKGISQFGPLFSGIVLDKKNLSPLVRMTAISASRAQRDILPFYENFFEERFKALQKIFLEYKGKMSYEEFISALYSPNSVNVTNDAKESMNSFIRKHSNTSSTSIQTLDKDSSTDNQMSDLSNINKNLCSPSMTSRSSIDSSSSQKY